MKMFNTAYYIAMNEMPFTVFPAMCAIQRKNGLEGIGDTYMNDKAASTFIGYINKMMVADLAEI